MIGGTIGFELLLPDKWNSRFVMGGGGGFVGRVSNQARNTINQGYATVGTDTGHQWPSGLKIRWALDNVEAQVNYGYLAIHRTAQVAKSLIHAYYGSDPKYSYFTGCSTGGGQALIEAQRYPEDFDGIISAAPVVNHTGLAAARLYNAMHFFPDPTKLDKPIITAQVLQRLHAEVLKTCDEQDGVERRASLAPANWIGSSAGVRQLASDYRRGGPSISPLRRFALRLRPRPLPRLSSRPVISAASRTSRFGPTRSLHFEDSCRVPLP
jgi:hypothetical protein